MLLQFRESERGLEVGFSVVHSYKKNLSLLVQRDGLNRGKNEILLVENTISDKPIIYFGHNIKAIQILPTKRVRYLWAHDSKWKTHIKLVEQQELKHSHALGEKKLLL